MNSYRGPPNLRGNPICIFFLTVIQFLVGGITFSLEFGCFQQPLPYRHFSKAHRSTTSAFGAGYLFTYGIWKGTTWSWIGIVGISLFVLLVDTLALLELPTIPGIPKFAGAAEIFYSLVVLFCLSQKKVKANYGIKTGKMI
jgi:hypothetical protein